MGNLTQISMWLPEDLLNRAGALVGRMAASDVGAMLGAVNRSDVLRMAIFKGVAALEAELPPARPGPAKGPQEGPERPPKATRAARKAGPRGRKAS